MPFRPALSPSVEPVPVSPLRASIAIAAALLAGCQRVPVTELDHYVVRDNHGCEWAVYLDGINQTWPGLTYTSKREKIDPSCLANPINGEA